MHFDGRWWCLMEVLKGRVEVSMNHWWIFRIVGVISYHRLPSWIWKLFAKRLMKLHFIFSFPLFFPRAAFALRNEMKWNFNLISMKLHEPLDIRSVSPSDEPRSAKNWRQRNAFVLLIHEAWEWAQWDWLWWIFSLLQGCAFCLLSGVRFLLENYSKIPREPRRSLGC